MVNGNGPIIDHLISKNGLHTLIHSDSVTAMSLNGLGIIERRLSIYPEYALSYTRVSTRQR